MRDTTAILLSTGLLAACAAPGDGGGARLLVSDVEAGRIVEVDAATGDMAPFVTERALPPFVAPEGLEPAGMLQDGDRLLVTDAHSGRVLAFDAADGAFQGLVFDPGREVDLEEPCALAALGEDLAVLGNDTQNVLLIGPEGAVGELGGSVPPAIRGGHGLLALDGGRLLVATSPSLPDEGMLQVWDPATGTRVATWQPPGALQDATGLVGGPEGWVHVVDWVGAQVVRVDPADGALLDRVLGPEDLEDPVAAAFDAEGTLWVLERRGLVAWTPLDGARRVLDGAFEFGRGLVVLPR